jgi:hypothetical protein
VIPKTAGETGQVRRVAFSAWAWILSLFFGLLFVGLTILTIGTWFLGRDTMTNPVTDLGFLALGGVIVGAGFAVQLKAPESNVSGMQQALIGLLALAFAGLIGARIEPMIGGLIFLMAAVVLAALHPARGELLKRPGHVSPSLAVLSIVAAIPAAAYAGSMLVSAREAGASCFLGRCAHGDRFAEMAALAIAIALIGMLAALKARGWIVTALSAGVSGITVGLASIGLPNVAGSLGQVGGTVAIAWGVLFVVLAEREAMETRRGVDVAAR